jgi:hypothetical protein
MPKCIDAQPGHEVEILLTLEVKEEDALPTLKADWIPVIGRKKKSLFKFDDLIEAGHELIVERRPQMGLGSN